MTGNRVFGQVWFGSIYQADTRYFPSDLPISCIVLRLASPIESLVPALFDRMPIGLAIADTNGRLVTANATLRSMLGYAEDELPESELAQFLDTEQHRRLCSGELAGYEVEKRLLRRDGTFLCARILVSRIEPEFSVHLIEDITERKKSEQSRLDAQKIEAVARLASGFAHDFNNLLTIINGYSQILLRKLPSTDSIRTEVEEILEAGERATLLTQRLLAFSRHQVHEPKPLDLNAVVRGLHTALRRLLGDQIGLDIQLTPMPGCIRADQTQIEQIVLNIAANARDAMPKGGNLIVALEASPTNGGLVTLSIADTGLGMDEQTRRKMFEPFFTTKEAARHTGLGLWTVYEAVEQSHGTIAAESEPGLGTRITISWPNASRETQNTNSASALSAGEASAIQGPKTILLAEDDEFLRGLTREILESEGYRVLPARDGVEALSIAGQEKDIQLLITDVTMPNMSGADLCSRLAKDRPGLKVLFMSGFADYDVSAGNPAGSGTSFLQKPFRRGQLLESVKRVLDTLSR